MKNGHELQMGFYPLPFYCRMWYNIFQNNAVRRKGARHEIQNGS